MDEPKTTQEELVHNLEAVEITVTKKTTGEALCCNGSDPENHKSDHTFTIITSMFSLVWFATPTLSPMVILTIQRCTCNVSNCDIFFHKPIHRTTY